MFTGSAYVNNAEHSVEFLFNFQRKTARILFYMHIPF